MSNYTVKTGQKMFSTFGEIDTLNIDDLYPQDTSSNFHGSFNIIKNNDGDPYLNLEEEEGNKRLSIDRDGLNGLSINLYDNTDDSIVKTQISNSNSSFFNDGLALGPDNTENAEILDVSGNVRIRNCGDLIQTCDTLPTGEYLRLIRSLQTSDATPTIIYSIRPFQDDFIRIDGTVCCKQSGGTNTQAATWSLKGFICRGASGGSNLIFESVTDDDKSWNASLDVEIIKDNNDIAVRVTGLAGTDIEWYVALSVLHYDTP